MRRFWFIPFIACGFLALVLASPSAGADPKPKSNGDEEISFSVPKGSPEELAKYIQDLQKKVNLKVSELQNNLKKASLETADAILAGKPGDKEGELAVNLKMQYLRSPQELTELANELKEAGHEKLARLALGRIWQIRLSMAARMSPANLKDALESSLKFLAEKPVAGGDVRLGQFISQLAENVDDENFTQEVYRKLDGLFSKSADKAAASFGKKMAGVLRRLTLLGKPIELEGKLLDGKPLDMSKFKGKVVLIDFWTTWCGWCVREIPNMKKNYKAYHDKGFDIIGVSGDDNRKVIEDFVKEKKIPWNIVYGENKPSPSIEYYGIMGYPTMFLVDRDGKVVSLNARGEELDKLLEKYFGSEKK
jgi:thiol-disulfide isomerase/thioredoxin